MSLQLNNKAAFNTLRTDIEAALQSVATQHGLNIRTGKISYESHGGECSIKLEVTTKEKPQAAANMDASMLDMYGLKGYHNQQIRTHDGQIFIVKGINSRARKMPVVLERLNGGGGVKAAVDYILKRCTLVSGMKIEDKTSATRPGTLTRTPAPGTVFGTAREIAGGRMWTIHHDKCRLDNPGSKLTANFHSGKLPREHEIVTCKCGQRVQITEALTFEDQL